MIKCDNNNLEMFYWIEKMYEYNNNLIKYTIYTCYFWNINQVGFSFLDIEPLPPISKNLPEIYWLTLTVVTFIHHLYSMKHF